MGLVRKLIAVICLFPASFIHYPNMKAWMKALCSGKSFFTDMLQKNFSVRQHLAKSGLFSQLLIGIPFQIACGLIEEEHLAQKDMFLRRRPVIVPLPPGKIDLIPGLASGEKAAREKAHSLLQRLPKPTSSIAGAVHSLWENPQDFSGGKVIVIAHWDPENTIDPYVRHLARSFKKSGRKVVIASASRPENVDLNEAREWTDAIIYRTCSGYDFTSWKAALEFYPSLYACNELVLTNDSFFGPIGSFEDVHRAMAAIDCDFWGLVNSYERQPHLQSYYLVFSSRVLTHNAFKDFFDRVGFSDDRRNAIVYETSLALWFASYGFQPGAYCVAPEDGFADLAAPPPHTAESLRDGLPQEVFTNLTTYSWDVIIRRGVPIIKRELFTKPEFRRVVSGWTTLCSERDYPIQLVYDYMKRRHVDIKHYQR